MYPILTMGRHGQHTRLTQHSGKLRNRCVGQTHPAFSIKRLSCVPESRDGFRQPHVRSLELIQAKGDQGRRGVQPPHESLPGLGQPFRRDVVDDHHLESEVGVDQDHGAQDGIHRRVQRPRGEGGEGEGDQTRGDDTLESPVVGAVRRRRRRDRCGVVDCVREWVSIPLWVGQVNSSVHTSTFDSFYQWVSIRNKSGVARWASLTGRRR